MLFRSKRTVKHAANAPLPATALPAELALVPVPVAAELVLVFVLVPVVVPVALGVATVFERMLKTFSAIPEHEASQRWGCGGIGENEP